MVFYSVLGDATKIEAIDEALVRLTGYIRKLVGERIRLRYTPEIQFKYDSSIIDSAHLEQTLAEIKATMPFDSPEEKKTRKSSS